MVAAVRGAAPYPPSVDNGRRQRRLRIRKRFLSGAISLVLVVLLTCQIFLPRFSKLRLLLILCATCWAAWLSLAVNRLFHFLATPTEGSIQMMLQSWVLSYHDLFRVALARASYVFFCGCTNGSGEGENALHLNI